MNSQLRTSTVVVALVACFAFQPAHAGPKKPVIPSEVISFGELDLTKDSDARVLYRRLQRAALRVCHEVIGPSITIEVGKCAAVLVDASVSEVNRPTLTAVHHRAARNLSASR